MTRRLALSVAATLALLGCETQVEPRPRLDAHVEPLDAAVEDAPGLDAPGIDAASVLDAASALDAFSLDGGWDASPVPLVDAYAPDAFWGTCSSGGRMGTCMPMSLCTGTAVMGLCPGPFEIQCCLPSTDAGMVDAYRPAGAITPADVLARLGACSRIGGDYARDSGGTEDIPVCQTDSVIWWSADMDIDCDGGRGSVCMSDPYYLPDTSAVDSMGNPLDASTLPFIVIPLASSRFRYADHGIRAGQVALVLYRDRMVFGIFGDLGPAGIIGEASYAMAEALGIPSSPISGGVGSGVTYLVFTGTSARVTRNEDHAEAVRMGEALLDAFVGP